MTYIQTYFGGVIGNRGERTKADVSSIDLGYDYADAEPINIGSFFSENSEILEIIHKMTALVVEGTTILKTVKDESTADFAAKNFDKLIIKAEELKKASESIEPSEKNPHSTIKCNTEGFSQSFQRSLETEAFSRSRIKVVSDAMKSLLRNQAQVCFFG